MAGQDVNKLMDSINRLMQKGMPRTDPTIKTLEQLIEEELSKAPARDDEFLQQGERPDIGRPTYRSDDPESRGMSREQWEQRNPNWRRLELDEQLFEIQRGAREAAGTAGQDAIDEKRMRDDYYMNNTGEPFAWQGDARWSGFPAQYGFNGLNALADTEGSLSEMAPYDPGRGGFARPTTAGREGVIRTRPGSTTRGGFGGQVGSPDLPSELDIDRLQEHPTDGVIEQFMRDFGLERTEHPTGRPEGSIPMPRPRRPDMQEGALGPYPSMDISKPPRGNFRIQDLLRAQDDNRSEQELEYIQRNLGEVPEEFDEGDDEYK